MPYPYPYTPITDFARTEQDGDAVSGTRLAMELANIAASVNALRDFIKAGFTADKQWQPSEALAQTLSATVTHTATAAQTDFELPGSVTVDPSAAKALVWVNGALIDPDDVTIEATQVVIAAQDAGAEVVVALYEGGETVLTQLASTLADLGASLVGIEDAAGNFTAEDVEGALAEVKEAVDTLITDLGSLATIIRSDGSVDFANDQSMGGFRLTDLADGTDAQDAATVAQLAAFTAILADLGTVYLPRVGGVMSGNIDMGDNFLLNVKDGVEDGDAVNKGQLDALADTVNADFLRLSGGTMTGDVDFATNRIRNLPVATEDDEPVRKDQIADLVELLNAANFGSGGAGSGQVLTADGSGGASWETPSEVISGAGTQISTTVNTSSGPGVIAALTSGASYVGKIAVDVGTTTYTWDFTITDGALSSGLVVDLSTLNLRPGYQTAASEPYFYIFIDGTDLKWNYTAGGGSYDIYGTLMRTA